MRNPPLWQGPQSGEDHGGITFSLLSRWIVCRERARIYMMEGIRPRDTFNHKIEYGSMWHVCEEAHAKGHDIVAPLIEYCRGLCRKYPTDQLTIKHWFNVCRTQFPLYVEYWSEHPDVVGRRPLSQEEVFHTPYKLPSGRTVYLRGKRDGTDIIGQGVWLNEHKTKGDIRPEQVQRQLTFDLQTMMYLIALIEDMGRKDYHTPLGSPANTARGIVGVRYNVVRRPLSGGKGTIVRHKPTKNNPHGESEESFYNRLADYIKEEPEHYFMRWNVDVGSADTNTFKHQCLDPILENLCDDYDWWEWCMTEGTKVSIFDYEVREFHFPKHHPRHFRFPFGVFNALTEGGGTDLDEHMATGSMIGLEVARDLFPELRV